MLYNTRNQKWEAILSKDLFCQERLFPNIVSPNCLKNGLGRIRGKFYFSLTLRSHIKQKR